MLKKLNFILPVFALIVFESCQKELQSDAPTRIDSTPVAVVDTAIVKPVSDSYLPLTKNNSWKYKDTANGDLTTITVTGNKQTLNNKSYEILKGSLFAGPMFFTVKDHDYFIVNDLSSVQVEILFLNDIAEVGTTWTVDLGLFNGSPAMGTGKVLQRNMKLKSEGKTYLNVIHTQFQVNYEISGVPYSHGTYDYYTAKGVGIVKVESNFGIFEPTGSQVLYANTKNLVDFSVK